MKSMSVIADTKKNMRKRYFDKAFGQMKSKYTSPVFSCGSKSPYRMSTHTLHGVSPSSQVSAAFQNAVASVVKLNLDGDIDDATLEVSVKLAIARFVMARMWQHVGLFENLVETLWGVFVEFRLCAQIVADPLANPFRPFGARRGETCLEGLSPFHQFGLEGLRPGVEWLMTHRPPGESDLCIVHKDFHPVNVMVEGGAVSGVLDWPNVDIADRHVDLGFTLFLLEAEAAEPQGLWQRLVVGLGRRLLTRLYLRAYRRQLPVDRGLLRYYRSLIALRRLAQYGIWRQAGAEATGSRPDVATRLSDKQAETVARYFRRHTGVEVRL